MPLMQQSVDEIVVPMVAMKFTLTEYAALKALIFWRGGTGEFFRQWLLIKAALCLVAQSPDYRTGSEP